MAELIVVIAIISILLLVVSPPFKPTQNYISKNLTNTTHKILVNAIDYWSRDNIEPLQKPANFNSVNSQNHKVYEYISNKEIYNNTNIKIENGNLIKDTSKTKNIIDVDFNDGVLKTTCLDENGSNIVQLIYPVFKLNPATNSIEDISYKKDTNMLIVNDYKPIISVNP